MGARAGGSFSKAYRSARQDKRHIDLESLLGIALEIHILDASII
jgi:hypothetical protein